MNTSLGVVVLAAGQGTRMHSDLPKVLHPLGGRPLLRHVLDTADALLSTRTVVVLAADTVGQVSDELGARYGYAVQAERRGTGHALLQARALLEGAVSRVLVLFGDTPLLRPATAQALVETGAGAAVALLSFVANPATGYGRVLRDGQGRVLGIVEERDASPEQRLISEAASGLFCFDAAWLWPALEQLGPSPLNGEYYLTSLPAMAVAAFGPGAVVARLLDDAGEALGINDRAQLAQADAVLRGRTLQALMASGVTVIDPQATYVDAEVTVGRDSVLWPGTVLQGHTSIGCRCTIGPHAHLSNCTVGDDARIGAATLAGVAIAAGTTITAYTVLTHAPR